MESCYTGNSSFKTSSYIKSLNQFLPSSLITSTNINIMIFLLYFPFYYFQQCLHMEMHLHFYVDTSVNNCYLNIADQKSALPKHTLNRNGEIRTQIHLTPVPSIYNIPYQKQLLFLLYFKKKIINVALVRWLSWLELCPIH